MVFAQLERAAEQEALKLVAYAAEVFDDCAIDHPRVLSGKRTRVKVQNRLGPRPP